MLENNNFISYITDKKLKIAQTFLFILVNNMST